MEQQQLPNHQQTFILHTNLKSLLKSSTAIDAAYTKSHNNFETINQTLNIASKTLAPLQSLSIAAKALETRINRAISPSISLLETFKHSESLQNKLLKTASKLQSEKNQQKRLKKLIKYISYVEELNDAVTSIGRESVPAVQKLQEVVEFLSRTKATDGYRTERLRETLVTLKAVCETEVESMKFDGVLDEGLLNLQDEYEGLLQKLKHSSNLEENGDSDGLGSDLEIEVLRRISHTLTANDCLDICIDLFVKVRYRRAAKALMRLNPDYLKTYTPEEINQMEWELLETAISLWIHHLTLAIKTVLVSEKILCTQVLGNIMDGIIWPECFVKIADKIMAVFFRFAEGITRSNKEPQKLFKLLDMLDSLRNLKPQFHEVFDGEPGADICSRFRELEKLLVHASTRVLFEFGLQIESNQDPPPPDGSVPKLVRYAINYLKNLSIESYSESIAEALSIEQLWRCGVVGDAENLLKEAVVGVMEALQRNIEAKKTWYKDKVVANIFAMNTFWYMYMRTRNTNLANILGDQYTKTRYRHAAEESAYQYQKMAWGSLVKLLEKDDEAVGPKMKAFVEGFDEMYEKHRTMYKIVSDADLRVQMRDATVRMVVPAYTQFYLQYSHLFPKGNNHHSPQAIRHLLAHIFVPH